MDNAKGILEAAKQEVAKQESAPKGEAVLDKILQAMETLTQKVGAALGTSAAPAPVQIQAPVQIPDQSHNQFLNKLQELVLLQQEQLKQQQRQQRQPQQHGVVHASLAGGQVVDPWGNVLQVDPGVPGGLRQPTTWESWQDAAYVGGALAIGVGVGYLLWGSDDDSPAAD